MATNGPPETRLGRLIEACPHGQVTGWSCHRCGSGGHRADPPQYRLADFLFCRHEPLYAAAMTLVAALNTDDNERITRAKDRLEQLLNEPEARA